MKLEHLIAMPFAMIADLCTLGEAEAVDQVFADSRRQQTTIRKALEQAEANRWMPIDDWHEDIGPCFWARFPIDEPYYAGSPLDEDWPEYHTHFIPMTVLPIDAPEGGE